MSSITIERLTGILEDYARRTGASIDILLIGGLALQAYGYSDRATEDMDGEMAGETEPLVNFLRAYQIPADLGEDLSRWSVIAILPGYRERASVLLERSGLRLRLLHPIDFVIAKLRRGTDLDLQDAAYVMHRFDLTLDAVQEAASSYAGLFQDVSVPVEVCVRASGELATSLEEGWGVAAVAPCARSTGSLRPFGPCCQLN